MEFLTPVKQQQSKKLAVKGKTPTSTQGEEEELHSSSVKTIVKKFEGLEEENGEKTVNRFSRKVIDETFGQGTSNLGFEKHGKKTTKIEKASPAVKEGLVKLKINGQIDGRCSAVKKGLVTLDKEGDVIKNDSVLCKDQIKFCQNGQISKSSSAVQEKIILLKKNGDVDGRCAAVKKGWITIDKETGDIDGKHSILKPGKQLHLKETNGAHISGFEVIDAISKGKEFLELSFLFHLLSCRIVYQCNLSSTTKLQRNEWCMLPIKIRMCK